MNYNKRVAAVFLMMTFIFLPALHAVEKISGVGFVIKNPDVEQQQILLVPSRHDIRVDMLDKSLVAAIKKSDILVLEKKARDWMISQDNKTILKGIMKIWSPKELISQLLISKKYTYKISYGPGGKNWSTRLSPSAAASSLLKEMINYYGVKIDNIHPSVIVYNLSELARRKEYRTGMDGTFAKFFMLAKKPIFGLETRAELEREGLIRFIREEQPSEEVKKIEDLLSKSLRVATSLETPSKRKKRLLESEDVQAYLKGNQVYEKFFPSQHPEGIPYIHQKRTEMWVDKLINIIKNNKNKSIVIMVGIGHIFGERGLNNLLREKGFEVGPIDKSKLK